MSISHNGLSLLALETAGNQAFIYRSPKLREAIGASALVADAGTRWVEAAMSGTSVRPVVTTSGKAVLVGPREELVRVLRSVTLRALADAPGLEVTGGIVDIDGGGFFPALKAAFEALARNRSHLRGPDVRFRRLPIVDTCVSTGLPAAAVQRVGSDARPLSHESIAKRAAADRGWHSMASAVDGLDFTRSIDRLDAGSSSNWTAVVHADGSGMGQLFLAFDQHLRAIGRSIGDLDDASAAYSELSMAIEQCTNAAWQDAARSVGRATDRRRDQADVVPVLLGGDDITVVIDGALALDFAEEYLRAFTRETGNSAALKGLGVGPLSAGAAVVWTKPGFPFSISYQLAEHRLSEAKRVAKSKGSAGAAPAVIDVAVVYDTSLDDVDHRAADNLDIRLTANPYAIDRHEGLASLSELKALIKELASDALPSSQVHELRSLLSTLGVAAAQRRLDELRTSHPALFEAVHPLVHDNGVMLLDALDIADAAGRSDGEDL